MMLSLASIIIAVMPVNASPIVKNYGDVTVTGAFQSGHFLTDNLWDLTKCDMTISFTCVLTGVTDGAGDAAYGELGVRDSTGGDFNPDNKGVWLATARDPTTGTFGPDSPSPTLDLDDKLQLQKVGGHGEGDYNLPSVPPIPGDNHRFWFDRDGVDASQALNPLAINGKTYNTLGTYDIVLTLHATSATAGTVYMTINGLAQGFETDVPKDFTTMELSPAGMTFTGNMQNMQVFYGIFSTGNTSQNIHFNQVTVNGCLFGLEQVIPEVPLGAVVAAASMLVAFGAFVGLRRRKSISALPPT